MKNAHSALLADIEDADVVSIAGTSAAEKRAVTRVAERIIAAPAVDAVEVVRCEKCRFLFRLPETNIKAGALACELDEDFGYPEKADDFFCAYGEPHEE